MPARSTLSFSAALLLLGVLLPQFLPPLNTPQSGGRFLPPLTPGRSTLHAQSSSGGESPGESPKDDATGAKDAAASTYTVTFYELWGSVEKRLEKPPKALEKLLPKLRKHTGKNSFRLAAKPVVRKMRLGDTYKKTLPQKYTAEWTLVSRKGKFALRQKLTNPRKRSSVLLLKKCPVITELTRIRQASEFFILVVDFGPTKKK